jgi:hypothetical protein
MPFVCDAHVHLYPAFPLATFFGNALRNLDSLYRSWAGKSADNSEPPAKICCLAERFDCRFFRDLSQNAGTAAHAGFAILPGPEENSLFISLPDEGELVIIAGRQIVTSERLEVLALSVDAAIPDGLPFPEVHRAILLAGGLPVLNWAPGKWFFARGRLVKHFIDSLPATELLLCDTTLRPTLWPTPLLMREARRRGIRTIAGSDPLPLPGEERYAGTYGIASKAQFDPKAPVSSLRKLLRNPQTDIQITGRRCPAWTVINRVRTHMRSKPHQF